MMPPVDVPAIKSKSSAAGRSVRRSISVSTAAGITPRIPPPSIESTRTEPATPATLTDYRPRAIAGCSPSDSTVPSLAGSSSEGISPPRSVPAISSSSTVSLGMWPDFMPKYTACG